MAAGGLGSAGQGQRQGQGLVLQLKPRVFRFHVLSQGVHDAMSDVDMEHSQVCFLKFLKLKQSVAFSFFPAGATLRS